jgi:hypothetical protein
MADLPGLRFEGKSLEPTPRIIVKAILQPPVIDSAIAQALVARYIPLRDR